MMMLALLVALAQTTDNNSSCDISVTPAATLLLPYFEVDTAAAEGAGATTLFTVTNASPNPQVAHVTIWTEWAYPVLAFNLALTGYDVQGVNLRDVIVSGKIPPTRGDAPGCAQLPQTLHETLAITVRSALTVGSGYVGCSGPVGGIHPGRAIGYVTIDVVSYCSTLLPTDAAYYAGPEAPLLFDNVLLGDYQQLGQGDARGNSMVHIRAIPEGGRSGVPVATNLPFTFYDRYTPQGMRAADRRQPLPSTFIARFIEGGTGEFATDFKIWREGVTAGLPGCMKDGAVRTNSAIAVTSVIRFDEHENSWDGSSGLVCGECVPSPRSLPATSRIPSTSGLFAGMQGNDVGGWIYLNLGSQSLHVGNFGLLVLDTALSAQRVGFAPPALVGLGSSGSRTTTTQNWVVVSHSGSIRSLRLAVDFDAVGSGNGCTPAPPNGAPIRPSLVCPNGAAKCGAGTVAPPVNP